MLLGYARVSTTEQDTALQLAALKQVDATAIWEEHRSGVKQRPALEDLLATLAPGDTLVVYKVDRLARSLTDLLRIAQRIEDSGASLRSLTEPIETGTPAGRMIFQLLGVFAEFERSVIRERCEAGRTAAKARGTRFGARRKIDYEAVIRMRDAGETMVAIARHMEVSHAAISHILRRVRDGLTPVHEPRAPAAA